MPHNSVLWIWLKMGYLGFVAMLFLIARAVQHGARSVLRIASPDRAAVAFGALAYVVMYMIYAYVDIAWDIRSMVFLAVAFAICADAGSPATPPEAPEGETFESRRAELESI
jgi:O-antigen ligase